MKTKLSLLLILTFGFVLSASADISCEPMGGVGGGNWFCEEIDAVNAQSFSWSTGSNTPFTFVSCGLSTNVKHVSLTITHTNGSTSTLSRFFHCQNFIY